MNDVNRWSADVISILYGLLQNAVAPTCSMAKRGNTNYTCIFIISVRTPLQKVSGSVGEVSLIAIFAPALCLLKRTGVTGFMLAIAIACTPSAAMKYTIVLTGSAVL